MKCRRAIAALLTTTMLSLPATARAQEVESPVTVEVEPEGASADLDGRITVETPDVLALTSAALSPRAPSAIARTRVTTPASSTTDIRLSHGAKTAIIVTAIVVGVLIIVAVVALGHPGHLP
jgi:hypothetical protein